ncbi:MAG TPA: hypothetical protein VJB94_04115 [Candidatus Nanoarchaeia archaeon]|nr:hypothetical protein [Candidatus Nanoarchaeia archaeon]
MHKKGQITAFVIVGIVVAAAIILVLYLRGQFFLGPVTPENLQTRFEPIREHVEGCLAKIGSPLIEKIGIQGGYLSSHESTYRMKNSVPISYLCYDVPDQDICSNRMLTLNSMEDELAKAINTGLMNCLNLKQFEKGFDIRVLPNYNTEVSIGEDNVLLTLNMATILSKGGTDAREDKFQTSLKYPLGRLYNVAQDIINVEAQYGDFEQLNYMLAKKGQYVINKDKPYPDKLYVLQTKDSKYIFQFFIEGEPN